MKTNKIEQFKTSGIELFASKDEKELPTITGYLIKFNTFSDPWYGIKAIVEPGFFDGILEDPDLCVLASYTHDTDGLNVVARLQPSQGVEKIKLSVDSIGMKYEVQPVNTQLGRDLVEQIRHGNVQGVSMGVAVDEDDWTGTKDGYPVRRMIRCSLLDHFAFTSIPAFPSTTSKVSGFSLSPEMKEFYEQKAKELAPNVKPLDWYQKKMRVMSIDS